MNTPSTKLYSLAFSVVVALAITTNAVAAPGTEANVLWYNQPAQQWTEALPVGNGRISAMIFGGASQERLQLNEGTLWAGGPYDPVNPEAKAALPEVRQLINDGKYREASRLPRFVRSDHWTMMDCSLPQII